MTQPNSAVETAVTRDGRPIEFARDDALRRYVARVDGAEAAVAEYLLTSELVIFNHTVTEPGYEGQGVASALVKWALEDVRDAARHVLPVCPFVKSYIERHESTYADLVYRADPAAAKDVSLD